MNAVAPRFVAVAGGIARAEHDWYQDMPEATEALLRAEQFSGLSWDPACGVGTIPHAMMAAGISCIGSDLVDRKPVDLVGFRTMDFLAEDVAVPRIDNIVSNPPFNVARKFADKALSIATHKVAFLLPLTFLEGQDRTRWLETTPLARVHVFSWRISMPPGVLLQAGSVRAEGGKKAFAWFVWEQGWRGPAQVRFLHRPVDKEAA
jgi:hypothetical protein